MNNKSDQIKKAIKYGTAIVCGAAIAVYMVFSRNISGAENATERYRILCDASSVPGLLMILVGILIWLSGQGAFAGLGYLGRYLRRSLVPGGRTKYPHETFYDYLQEKKEKRGSVSYSFLFIIGAAFLAVGIVFLVLYYKSL